MNETQKPGTRVEPGDGVGGVSGGEAPPDHDWTVLDVPPPGTPGWLALNPPGSEKWILDGVTNVVGSAAPKHRIVHAWHSPQLGRLWVLGSDGRLLVRNLDDPIQWDEITCYPPGLEP